MPHLVRHKTYPDHVMPPPKKALGFSPAGGWCSGLMLPQHVSELLRGSVASTVLVRGTTTLGYGRARGDSQRQGENVRRGIILTQQVCLRKDAVSRHRRGKAWGSSREQRRDDQTHVTKHQTKSGKRWTWVACRDCCLLHAGI